MAIPISADRSYAIELEHLSRALDFQAGRARTRGETELASQLTAAADAARETSSEILELEYSATGRGRDR
jgi:hypothetical protein